LICIYPFSHIRASFLSPVSKSHSFYKAKRQPMKSCRPVYPIKSRTCSSIHFVTFCSYSTLLPRAWAVGYNQLGCCHGAYSPARISGCRPHCVFPIIGAVTGRKYHHRLHRSSQYPPAKENFKARHFPLCTFDVILFTDALTICRWSWRVFLRCFRSRAVRANVS